MKNNQGYIGSLKAQQRSRNHAKRLNNLIKREIATQNKVPLFLNKIVSTISPLIWHMNP